MHVYMDPQEHFHLASPFQQGLTDEVIRACCGQVLEIHVVGEVSPPVLFVNVPGYCLRCIVAAAEMN